MSITRREFTQLAAAASAASLFAKIAIADSADDLASLTLSEAAAKIRSGAVTSTQLTQACLARISTYDSKLDAFITVAKEKAFAQAAQLDAEQKAGKLRGPLHG